MRNLTSIMLGASFLVVAAAGLTGCSNATVSAYPTSGGAYDLVAMSSSEGDALTAATKKATKICSDEQKQLQVQSAKTTYQGAYDKKTQKDLNIASDVAAVATGGLVPSSLASSDNDYVTKMHFVCK